MSDTSIKQIKISGIGKFNTPKILTFEENFNLISKDRESGKTTIINSLLWSLFDEEFEYFESIKDHEKSFVELKVKNNKNSLVDTQLKKDIDGNLEIDKDDFIKYKKTLSKIKDLLIINESKFNSSIIPQDIISIFKDLTFENKKIEIIKEYEIISKENYSDDIHSKIKKEFEDIKKDLNSIKELIKKNKFLNDVIEEENNNKNEILENQLTQSEYKKIKDSLNKLKKDYNLMKILLKVNLNDLDKKNGNSLTELNYIINDKLVQMMENIKNHFSNKVKDFNKEVNDLYFDNNEYMIISDILIFTEKYHISNIEKYENNLNNLEIELITINSLKKDQNYEEKINIKIKESIKKVPVLLDILKEFSGNFKEALKFCKLLKLVQNYKTKTSMMDYYEINDNNYNTLMRSNNKYPFYIVFQIYSNMKIKIKNDIKDSVSLEFNEDFMEDIKDLMSNYFEGVKKIKYKYLTEDENNIFNNNKNFFNENKNIEFNSIILKISDLIKEIEYNQEKTLNYENKQTKLKEVKEKIEKYNTQRKHLNFSYNLKKPDNSEALNELNSILLKQEDKAKKYTEENEEKIKIKNNYEEKIIKSQKYFEDELHNLKNNYLNIINENIKEYNSDYSIKIINNEVIFVVNSEEYPLKISKKEQKIIYKLSLIKYVNKFFNLNEESLIIFIDELDDMLSQKEFDNIKLNLSKNKDYQIILTERTNK